MSIIKNKILKNTIFLYIRMFVLMGVTLYTSRVILSELGVEKYGVWNLIAGVVVLFSFVQNAMATAIQRFISFHLGRNEQARTFDILYSSKTIHYYLSAFFVLIAETIGLLILLNYLNIPDKLQSQTITLYHIIIINTVLLIIRIPYNSWIIAYEKMSFFSITSIVEGLLNLFIVFILKYLPGDNLINYGILTVFVTLIINIWYFLYCKYRWNIKILFCIRSNVFFKELLSFSSYTMLGSISTIASNQGVNIIINIFFGVLLNAAMGVAQQVNGALVKFVSNFQTAFKPQLVKLYSSNNYDGLFKLIYNSSRISFFLLWILACPIIFELDTILSFWLGDVPSYSFELCLLMIACSLLESISSPLWMTIQATGNIKSYQITISLTYLSTILFTYLFFHFGSVVYYAIISKFIVDIIVLLERIYFSKRLFNLPIMEFVKNTLFRFIIIMGVSILACYWLKSYINQISSWLDLIKHCFLYFIIVMISIIVTGFSKTELFNLNKYFNVK